MRCVHPPLLFVHSAFQLFRQIVTDASRSAFLCAHLTPNLADIGTVGADAFGQFRSRAGFGNQKLEILQPNFFWYAHHAGNIAEI